MHKGSRWIALAFLGALVVYAAGAAPTVLEGDSGELQAVALAGGVAHSSGYPLFCLVGRVFGALLPGDPAFRVNLMSAFFGAASLGALVAVGTELGLSGAAAFAGAMVFGAGFSFWSASLRAEVYTVSVFVMLLAYLAVLVARRTERPRDRALAAVLLGLVLTGHLSALASVAFLGLVLAWEAHRAGRTLREWPVLMLAFVLGLTPYLYLVWADQHRIGFDYLHYVDWVFYPATGVPDAALDSPWERLRWLVMGRNLAPGTPVEFHPGDLLRAVKKHSTPVALFELGIPCAVFLLPGLARWWVQRRNELLRVLAMVGGSLLLAAQVTFGGLFALFLLFPLALVSLVVASGLEWTLDRLTHRAAVHAVVLPLLALLLMAPTHQLRRWAYSHPIGSERWMAHDEGSNRPLRLMYRRLKHPWDQRDFGRGVMRAAPESSLVIASWPEMGILIYHRYGLRERTDLTLAQVNEPGYLVRIREWQRAHDPARRPLFMVALPPAVRERVAVTDSVVVSRVHQGWIIRERLTNLPALRGDRLGE